MEIIKHSKKSLQEKIKNFGLGIVVVSMFSLPIYSIYKVNYDRFTADFNKEVRIGNFLVEEIYGFDRNKDGWIDEIIVYACTAHRCINIVPFIYHSDDPNFYDKLNIIIKK